MLVEERLTRIRTQVLVDVKFVEPSPDQLPHAIEGSFPIRLPNALGRSGGLGRRTERTTFRGCRLHPIRVPYE